MYSVFQRQGYGLAIAGRKVCGNQHLKRLKALTTVCFGFGFALQDVDDVLVIQGVTETIDGGRFIVGIFDGLVIVALISKLPLLDVVDGYAADANGASSVLIVSNPSRLLVHPPPRSL